MIHDAIRGYAGMFSVADILRKCPGISVDLVRKTLKDMQTEKIIECTGRGRNAMWRKKVN